jgi:holo-[acyl-carrier protein] synthase
VIETRPAENGVVASALALVEIDEVERLRSAGGPPAFTAGEEAYAAARRDPLRRLAARLAAKKAACRLLGDDIALGEVEVVRGHYGPPTLRLSPQARARLSALGADEALVSLTHERRHAAAVVLFLREAR